MTPKTRAVLLAALLAPLLILGGCGGSDAVGSATRPGAGSTTSQAPAVVKGPDGEVTDRTDPAPEEIPATTQGDGVTTANGLPKGFPRDEIPVVAGTVVGGSKGPAGGPYAYTVLLRVAASSPGAVVKGITAQLEGAGYRATPGMTMNQMSTSTYTSSKYAVGVNAIASGGKVTVTYVVKRK